MSGDGRDAGRADGFDPQDLDARFASLFRFGAPIVAAVSGGSDSTALLLLLADWLTHSGRPRADVVVATVDHALRPAAAAEAAAVLARASALGFPSVALRWEGAKPTTGLADAARRARYDLLAGVLRTHGARVLVTAHTRDDQAETLLMRLGRGAGVDGLAGMAAMTDLGDGLILARPLLAVAKASLVALLQARGETWCEDPTNRDLAFERPRLRAAQPALDDLGLSARAIALSARRLGRARAALDAATRTALEAASGVVREDGYGSIRVALAPLCRLPEEIQLRVLRAVVRAAGGGPAPVSLAALERLHAQVQGDEAGSATLAQAALGWHDGMLEAVREPGRAPLPVLPWTGAPRRWDGRFELTGPAGSGLAVAALGAEGLKAWEAAGGPRPPGVGARTLRALPAVWAGERLHAVPALGPPTPAGSDLHRGFACRWLGVAATLPAGPA